jgi:hypothetical protein
MKSATMSVTCNIPKTKNNVLKLHLYPVAKNISIVGNKNLGSVLLEMINFGECNTKSVMKLMRQFDLPHKKVIKNFCFTVDMAVLPENKSSYVIEGIENNLNDVQNHLYIDNPYLAAKKISVEFDLKSVAENLIVLSYKVFFNNEFIVESKFNHQTQQTFIKHLNFLHPLLVDDFHNEWLDFEFEDNTPLHTSLMDEAIKRQLNFNFNNEFGTFEEQFEDGGFRSKLDIYLRDKTIKFWNTNHETNNQREVNKKVITDVLSNILVAPLDNLNWMLEQCLNEQVSA